MNMEEKLCYAPAPGAPSHGAPNSFSITRLFVHGMGPTLACIKHGPGKNLKLYFSSISVVPIQYTGPKRYQCDFSVPCIKRDNASIKRKECGWITCFCYFICSWIGAFVYVTVCWLELLT